MFTAEFPPPPPHIANPFAIPKTVTDFFAMFRAISYGRARLGWASHVAEGPGEKNNCPFFGLFFAKRLSNNIVSKPL